MLVNYSYYVFCHPSVVCYSHSHCRSSRIRVTSCRHCRRRRPRGLRISSKTGATNPMVPKWCQLTLRKKSGWSDLNRRPPEPHPASGKGEQQIVKSKWRLHVLTLLPAIDGSSASFSLNSASGPSSAASSGGHPNTSVASLVSISARTAS